MGKRVILAALIVGIALMMFASAVVPAMAEKGGEKGPPVDVCSLLIIKLQEAGFTFAEALVIVSRMGC